MPCQLARQLLLLLLQLHLMQLLLLQLLLMLAGRCAAMRKRVHARYERGANHRRAARLIDAGMLAGAVHVLDLGVFGQIVVVVVIVVGDAVWIGSGQWGVMRRKEQGTVTFTTATLATVCCCAGTCDGVCVLRVGVVVVVVVGDWWSVGGCRVGDMRTAKWAAGSLWWWQWWWWFGMQIFVDGPPRTLVVTFVLLSGGELLLLLLLLRFGDGHAGDGIVDERKVFQIELAGLAWRKGDRNATLISDGRDEPPHNYLIVVLCGNKYTNKL